MKKDLANWTKNLQKTEKAMDKMREKIAIQLSQQETAMANLLNPA